MEILRYALLVISIIWSIGQIIRLRNMIVHSQPVVPSSLAFTLIFGVCIIGVLLLEVSPFHLLWLLPVSFVLSIVLLFFPIFQSMFMGIFLLLAMTKRQRDDEDDMFSEDSRNYPTEKLHYSRAKRKKKKEKGPGRKR